MRLKLLLLMHSIKMRKKLFLSHINDLYANYSVKLVGHCRLKSKKRKLPLRNQITFVEIHSPHGCQKMIINYKSVFNLLKSLSVNINAVQTNTLIYQVVQKKETFTYLSKKYIVKFSLLKKSSIPKVVIQQVSKNIDIIEDITKSGYFISKEPAQIDIEKFNSYAIFN